MTLSHQISLSQITLNMQLGVYAWERERPQPISFNIRFSFELPEDYTDGCMEKTVNYENITCFIKKQLPLQNFQTLEALARCVAQHLLSYSKIFTCHVEVTKYMVCQKFCNVTYSLSQSKLSH